MCHLCGKCWKTPVAHPWNRGNLPPQKISQTTRKTAPNWAPIPCNLLFARAASTDRNLRNFDTADEEDVEGWALSTWWKVKSFRSEKKFHGKFPMKLSFSKQISFHIFSTLKISSHGRWTYHFPSKFFLPRAQRGRFVAWSGVRVLKTISDHGIMEMFLSNLYFFRSKSLFFGYKKTNTNRVEWAISHH